MAGTAQATVLYKLTLDGRPLSVAGELAILPIKQAIFALEGTANPNPALYEIEGTFLAGATVEGIDTLFFAESCGYGFINVFPRGKLFTPPTSDIRITSSHTWEIIDIPSFVSFSILAGSKGENVTLVTKLADGEGAVKFRNTGTGEILVREILAGTGEWILTGGTWHDYGFWENTATWNF